MSRDGWKINGLTSSSAVVILYHCSLNSSHRKVGLNWYLEHLWKKQTEYPAGHFPSPLYCHLTLLPSPSRPSSMYIPWNQAWSLLVSQGYHIRGNDYSSLKFPFKTGSEDQDLIITDSVAAAKSFQSCLTLCDPIDGSPPGSLIPGILQARTLEWVAVSFSNAWKWKVKVKSLSRVRLLATPWTAAYQAPPSMGFSKQECWSRLPLPSPTDSVTSS